jgi:hypothetical protein
VRAINEGLPTTGRPSTLAVALAVILAVLGLVMAFYLGTTTRTQQVLPNTLNKDHISMRVDANQPAICELPRQGRLAASLL